MKKKNSGYPGNFCSQGGYTLLEALFGLAILMSVIIPLTVVFYKNFDTAQSQQSLTALSIIEQEAMLAKVFPEDVIPIKRKNIENREWVIKTDVSGKDPLVYRMAVYSSGIDSVISVFYGRSADAVNK